VLFGTTEVVPCYKTLRILIEWTELVKTKAAS